MKIDRKLKSRLKTYLLKKIKEENMGLVSVETPYKMNSSEEKLFMDYFPEFKKQNCQFLVNPDLIGGFVVRHGSHIIDASVSTKLDDLVAKLLI